MKLTPHEKKILNLIEKNPEIIDDTKKRAKVAKENELSEKTLRNRIGDLKKYGVISSENMNTLKGSNRNLKTDGSIKEDKLDPLVIINNNRTLIVKVSLITGIIGLIYALFATPYYQSTTSMYPALDTEKSGGILGGSIKGLAESYGLMGLGSAPTYNIPDIVLSRRIKKNIILSKWKSQAFPDSSNLIKFWEIDKPDRFSPYIILDLFRAFLPKAKGYSTSTDKIHLENAIEKLQRQIFVNEEQSGLIVVSVLMEDPFLSANITNYIAAYVKEFISLEQEKEAIKKKEFIFSQMQSAKIDLSDSEFKLTNFLKQNPLGLGNPDLQLQQGRLIREIEENQAVYITLRQQYEIAKIEAEEDKLFINILDEGDVAVRKSKPKRSLIVLSSISLGIMFSLLIVFYRERLYI
jgi:capsular polysaccharide biosynthesis protein|tara:strand:+ start:2056 stop:3279 length:1224 start_codon:yes stop_codon:yes gene_type:complete